MSELVAATEFDFETDFALLSAAQFGEPRPDCMTFVTSAPGAVGMTCGTKYARLAVRLERWDGEPPLDDEEWEDFDEVPFTTVAGSGLLAAGFDPADGDELPLDGLGRARIYVLARGRHRYSYSTPMVAGTNGLATDALPPEEWLLRVWPDPSARDALSGRPRRIAGRLPFEGPTSPWHAALRRWDETGWSEVLRGMREYDVLVQGLRRVRTPIALEQLWRSSPRPLDEKIHVRDGWDSDAQRAALVELAALGGRERLSTVGDLVEALVAVGLVARSGARVLPTPTPPLAWETMDVAPSLARRMRITAGRARYGPLQYDLEHLLRWAPDGRLAGQPLQFAVRLALPVESVLGALALLQDLGDVAIEGPRELQPDTPIVVSRT